MMTSPRAAVAAVLLGTTGLLGCLSAPPAAPVDGGCPGALYAAWPGSPYVLPVPVGQTVATDLTNCSGSYHSAGQPDQFAYDFRMDIGTIVTASRAGRVVHVVESGEDGGFPNNLVVVDHGDATFGQYMHLTQNGADVAVDQVVARGDTIGRSGATGLAGYPHLHFVVTNGVYLFPYQSIPVTFNNTRANPRGLLAWDSYVAGGY